MGEAVAVFLRERGQDEVDAVYRVINDIIGKSIRRPAMRSVTSPRSTDLRLFVSTTPDRLLAKAVNEVRFEGRPVTRELTFSLNQSTSEQSRNAQPASATDTVVLNLFGGPPPLPSMRSTRRTGLSGFTRCSARGEPSRLAC